MQKNQPETLTQIINRQRKQQREQSVKTRATPASGRREPAGGPIAPINADPPKSVIGGLTPPARQDTPQPSDHSALRTPHSALAPQPALALFPIQVVAGVRLVACPFTPHPRQIEFLKRDEREVLFGGACGGGKSAALLMAALQHVDVPGYAALILRRDTPRLWLAGGLIPRSHEWLAGTPAQWNSVRRQWTFPTPHGPPATLTFGFLATPLDKFRYASSEFQFLGYDELTELREEDYLFLFSRLRRLAASPVPLRVRAATNPGNTGHLWVKQRFIDGARLVQLPANPTVPADELPALESLLLRPHPICPGAIYQLEDRTFVPSLLADNPALDSGEYQQSLRYLPPVERERLTHGDWAVEEQALFRREWLRYYVLMGEQMELHDRHGKMLVVIPQTECRRFITVDPAGTADADQASTRCYSVIQVWDQPAPRELAKYLILRDQVREKLSLGELGRRLRKVFNTWRPECVYIENDPRGNSLQVMFKDDRELPRMKIELIKTENRSKEARAIPLENKFHNGEVFLPKYNDSWLPDFERELLAWTGHPDQPADQIDAAAYAAIASERHMPRTIRLAVKIPVPMP